MATFKATTVIEFATTAEMEDFIKKLPLTPWLIDDLLAGEEVVDENDQAEAEGVISTKHIFKVEEE